MLKRFVSLIAAVALMALAGCNTVHGLGQDIQRAGGAISGAAK
ncbi:MAG: entericidin A/B family lipoprotein [Pseudomonadota bacterium]|jgi:predicted small secreted protein